MFATDITSASNASASLALKDSLDIAMEKSPSMISAKENVTAADGKLGQAFGAVLPNLSVNGSTGNRYSQPQTMVIPVGTTEMSADIGTTETASTTSYTFTLTQPLYAGGRLLAGLDIAQANYDIAKANLRKAQFDLTYNVVNSYYGVLRTEKLYELSQESLDMAQSHLRQVKAMYSAGTATRADVLRAEVQVANMELSQTKADNALALAKDAFNNVLGRDLDAPIDLSEKEIAKEIVKSKTYAECVAMVFDTRPDWKVFQLTKKISDKMVGLQFANYFPMISLVGTSGNSKVDYPEYPGDSDINSWTVMASGTWTLFDGLATPSKIKEAQANLKALEANEDSIRNGIILEVKDACLNLNSAIDVIKSAKKAVESAEENYRISKEKYRSGIGSNLEMIDAQTALTETKTNLYQAQFDYQIAKAKTNKVVGKEINIF
jgi:outer membrane protein TolC